MTPLRPDSAGLREARRALAPPGRPRLRSRHLLACAAAMAAAALALCAVVVAGGGEPQAEAPAASVRAPLAR